MYQIWCQSVEQFDSFPRHLNLWPPKPPPPPQMPPGVLWGDLYLAYVQYQMNPQTSTKVGANRSSRLTASPDFWMFDPLKPPSAPLVSRRAICLACIHSQMNLHVCAKVGANRSSRLTASTDFWICDPLKPPKMPPVILRGELYLAYVHSQTNPQTCTKFGANQSSFLTASPDFWICDPPPPPKTPWCIEGRILFRLCPFPDESADVYQIWCQSVQLFDSFPWLLNLWPPPPKTPWGTVGRIVFSLCPFPDESADVHQIRCQSVQPFESFPRLLNLWPPPPPHQISPGGIEGQLGFSLCPFPDESADVNQSWCQSVQPFDRFPILLNVWPLNPPPP